MRTATVAAYAQTNKRQRELTGWGTSASKAWFGGLRRRVLSDVASNETRPLRRVETSTQSIY